MELKVRYHHSDYFMCHETFVCYDYKPARYFNRCTETGKWYTTSPTYFENCSPVSKDVVFIILGSDGIEVCRESNGSIEQSYTPVDTYIRLKANRLQSELNLSLIGSLNNKLLAASKWYDYRLKDCEDNWLYSPKYNEVRHTTVISSFSYMGIKFDVLKIDFWHKIAKIPYTKYVIKTNSDKDRYWIDYAFGCSF